jgi:hypothetical protein
VAADESGTAGDDYISLCHSLFAVISGYRYIFSTTRSSRVCGFRRSA